MSVALVTNEVPAYRIPLFKLLAEQLDCKVFLHGSSHADGQLDRMPFAVEAVSPNKLAARLRQENPEAIVCGLSGRSALIGSYLAARKLGVPFVLWASLWSHPKTPFHLLSLPPTLWLYRYSDAVVTYGPHVSRYVRHYRGSGKIFEATQAVDNDFFGRSVSDAEKDAVRGLLGIPPKRRFALYVGRMVDEKGIRTLLRAWSQAGKTEAELLVMAGAGPLTESAKAVKDVVAVGQVDREKLPALYASAEFLVLPSIKTRHFLEPWGLVINEAMNQGLAIVTTTDVGAAAAGLVVGKRNGYVLKSGNSDQLALAIEQLLSSSEQRTELGDVARADVSALTYEGMAKAFGDAVNTCL